MPITIEVRDSNIGKSMMQLKRTLIREGIFKELKKRKFYLKPSRALRLKREHSEQVHDILPEFPKGKENISPNSGRIPPLVARSGC